MKCPNCGIVLTEIHASHDYTIELNKETQSWVKHDVAVEYTCEWCRDVLAVHDIEDILKQVDEL